MTDELPNYVLLGGSGGIGLATAKRLATKGARLMLAGRNQETLTTALAELQAVRPGDYRMKLVDATQSAEVDALFAEAQAAFGSVHGASCLVGSILLKPAHLTTDAEFEQTLSQNIRPAFYMLRAAVKVMPTGGSIVLVSTVAAQIGLPNHEAIATAKGAIDGLVLSAAASYAGRGLRVNAVAPGLVRTPLASRITSSEAGLKASTAMHPLGRIGEPDDVAQPIAWLLDPATSWVTGQIISVDGGMSAIRGK
ncbi:MAG: SDR family NAD(P)-dependent oxidoreductase [Fimbriiglobus sp.]